jgi:hypothetical protein
MCVQVMPEKDAAKVPYNPFDLTKVWPHGDYPLIEVGVMELNRNPENYFAEVEQAAFNPANVVPGIGFSPDKMLQGAVLLRRCAALPLGVNHHQIPVNAPRCPVHSYHRDGRCAWTATTAAPWATSPTATASGRSSPTLPSRRWPSTARPTTGTTARTPTTYSQPRHAVPPDDTGAAAGAVRQHGPCHGRCADGLFPTCKNTVMDLWLPLIGYLTFFCGLLNLLVDSRAMEKWRASSPRSSTACSPICRRTTRPTAS